MTPKQNSLYWREWGAVVRHCKAASLPAPDRHDLHLAALGADRSHLAFTNEDFDRVLAEFRAHSRPEDIGAQLRQISQPRIRLKYAVSALAPAAYWSKIAHDKFGTVDLDCLSIEQLTQLRNTLADRRRARLRRERAVAVLTKDQAALVDQVKTYHAGVCQSFQHQVQYAFMAGLKLTALKASCPHGNSKDSGAGFIALCSREIPEISRSAAKRYMDFTTLLLEKRPTVGFIRDSNLLLENGDLPEQQKAAVVGAVSTSLSVNRSLRGAGPETAAAEASLAAA